MFNNVTYQDGQDVQSTVDDKKRQNRFVHSSNKACMITFTKKFTLLYNVLHDILCHPIMSWWHKSGVFDWDMQTVWDFRNVDENHWSICYRVLRSLDFVCTNMYILLVFNKHTADAKISFNNKKKVKCVMFDNVTCIDRRDVQSTGKHKLRKKTK